MQVNVTMRHGHLTEATQEKLTQKAEKLTRIFDRLTSIEVVVDLQDAQRPRVDLQVSAEHKHDFVAHEQSENLLTSVERAVHKVEQQLRKYKERTIDQHRNSETKRQELADGSDSDE